MALDYLELDIVYIHEMNGYLFYTMQTWKHSHHFIYMKLSAWDQAYDNIHGTVLAKNELPLSGESKYERGL